MNELNLDLYKKETEHAMGAVSLLGIDHVALEDGKITLTMEVKKQHLNTHERLHGGVLYALCDQAIAAFDIAMGRDGVALNGSIHYYRPTKEGDVLKAVVTNRKYGRRTAVCLVEVFNQEGKLVCDSLITSMYLDV